MENSEELYIALKGLRKRAYEPHYYACRVL
jgi:hypothetical protein